MGGMITAAPPERSRTSPRASGSVLIQRCRGHPCAPSGCAGDRDGVEPIHVQRSSSSSIDPLSVPPQVHDVLSSPGRSLDSETRSGMESRLGHDFR